MFIRRLISSSIAPCSGGHGCPDVLELDSGDFAVIGTDITSVAVRHLPSGSGCGPEERVVRVPRQVLVEAKTGIPDRL